MTSDIYKSYKFHRLTGGSKSQDMKLNANRKPRKSANETNTVTLQFKEEFLKTFIENIAQSEKQG